MKIHTTISTAKAAWAILKKANLHHFLDSGALAAIGTLSELKINVSDIITDLLENDVLIDLLSTITKSDHYIDADGKSVPWEDVDMNTVGELIADFFTGFTSAFVTLKSS